MPIPGLPAPLPSVTGGPATATSGDIKGDSAVRVGGISSPVVIGGFKSDGSASQGAVPSWVLIAGGAVALALIVLWAWKQTR